MVETELPPRPLDRALVVLAVLGALAFVVGEIHDLYWLRLLTKPLPVLAMIVILGRPDLPDVPYRWRIRRGLMASVAGDMLLEWSDSTFLPGVGAFLIAHLFYIAAFVGEDRRPRALLAVPFALWGGAVVALLMPGLGETGMLVPVAVYSTVICTMMWRATARLRPPATGMDVVLAAVGALLFAISDTLIAVDRFGTSFESAPYWIIALYWLGQGAITFSVLRRDPMMAEPGVVSGAHPELPHPEPSPSEPAP